MDEQPTYRPPGYPEIGRLWSQPPQSLPGPADHPFFRWVADGAKKDPHVLASRSPRPSHMPAALPLRPPPVITHMPSRQRSTREPSSTAEPTTPTQPPRVIFPEPSPAQTTPDLSTSPTEASPTSTFTATPASSGKRRQIDHSVGAGPHASPGGAKSAVEGQHPDGTSDYLRVVTNPEDS